MKKLIVMSLILLIQSGLFVQAQEEKTTDIFQKGQDGYACFRIPAIVKSKNGTLLAFAEARKNSCSDTGNIDLVLKRSEDGGKTWSSTITIWDDGDNVCGNPAPVLYRMNGDKPEEENVSGKSEYTHIENELQELIQEYKNFHHK